MEPGTAGDGLASFSAEHTVETLRYLTQRPFDNVYLYWLVATRQFERSRAQLMLWRDATGSIGGACSYGAQIIPAADGPRALAAFAEYASCKTQGVRIITGRRKDVEALWSAAAPAFPEPRAVRNSQPLYVIDRSALRYSRADANVARATFAELDEIAHNSAAMIAGEMGGDPRAIGLDFRARTARIIEAGWWWRYRRRGRLAFMCNVGAIMPTVAQIHGVWSPPEMRGRGYAARGLGAICDHLLDEVPNLSLYVNDFNSAALALYEGVGFKRAGEFQTILL